MWSEFVEKYPGVHGGTPSSYLSLWARLPDIMLADVIDSFEGTRELIRVPAMRKTVMVFTPEVYARVYPAFKQQLDRAFAPHLESMGIDEVLLQSIAEEIVEVIGDEDLSVSDIQHRMKRYEALQPGVLAAVLGALAARHVLIRARVQGDYASNRYTFAVWDRWLAPLEVSSAPASFRRAVDELAAHYFAAYPGATLEDFCWWGGWNEAQLRPLWEELEYSRMVSEPRPLEDTWPGWQLLPYWDALPMAYRRPQAWLPTEWTDWVYDREGNATSIVLRAGRCVGIWDLVRLEDVLHEVRVAFFDPRERISFELEQVITAMASFLEIEVGQVVQVRPLRNLKEAEAGSFASPLGDVPCVEPF